VERLKLVLDLIGALAIVCAIVAKLLPDGKAKEVLAELGFNLGRAAGRAVTLTPADLEKKVSEKEMLELLKERK
jgi:hypothetical protein